MREREANSINISIEDGRTAELVATMESNKRRTRRRHLFSHPPNTSTDRARRNVIVLAAVRNGPDNSEMEEKKKYLL